MPSTTAHRHSAHFFVIVLELASPARNLQKVADELKSLGNWWHCMDGAWIVSSTSTAREVRDQLRKRLDGDDKLLVLEVGSDVTWAGFMGEPAAWLKDNLLERGASAQARTRGSEVVCT
jgi:hypothetical protein